MSTKVLFVCLGNICRSPAAETVLRAIAEKQGFKDLIVTSCGIGDWHMGQPSDPRVKQAALLRGLTINTRAKPFIPNYLDEYDYILAADHDVLEFLYRLARTPNQKGKIHLINAYGSAYQGLAIPDPYYEGPAAFDQLFDILEDACQGLLQHIQTHRAT